MINLLPTDYAVHIRFGLQNNRLRLWLAGMAAAIAGLLIILAAGSAYLSNQSANYQRSIANSNQQLQAQNLNQAKKDAAEISGDIKVINQVLSQEVDFAGLLQTLGSLMPPRTVVTSISLSSTINGAINIVAGAIAPPDAAQISVNLSDPKKDLFSKIDIVSVTCTQQSTTPYKCTVELRAQFSQDTASKFLNVPESKKP